MTRKRWRIERVMVVPATWQGSVEHFYHFFLGYFMPLVLWQERTDTMTFTVRDCGPMNPWFELTRPNTDLDFMTPGWMLQRVLTHRQERQILHGWDDPNRFHRASLVRFTDTILTRLALTHAASGKTRITVLERRASPDFYLTGKSEAHGSGADWRSIPNTAEIASSLDALGDVSVVDTAALSPVQQIRLLASTDVLVAQHGAGLSNMVWMPPASAVVEMQPPLIPPVDTIFASLAAARGLDHVCLRQEDEHSAVDPAAVARAVEQVLGNRGQFVPSMPGSLPMRLMRQLPRRL